MRFGLRELLFVVVLLGLPVAAWWFVFQPINDEIEAVRQENVVKQSKLDKLEVARHIEDLGKEIGTLDEAIAMFEAKLPAEREVEVILREVWQLATQRGLRPKNFRTDKPVASTLYTELPIKMEMLGDFDGFYAFLLDLERLSRITRLPEMKLKKSKDVEGHMNATFTMTIFFEPVGSSDSNKA